MSTLKPTLLRHYHVYVASPDGNAGYIEEVTKLFSDFNRTFAVRHFHAYFSVLNPFIDSSTGVGDPHKLVVEQTLDKHRESLALAVFVITRQLNAPGGEFCARDAFARLLDFHGASGIPEIKFFFQERHQFEAPADPVLVAKELAEWDDVVSFKKEVQAPGPKRCYIREFRGTDDFPEVLRRDVYTWLMDASRHWAPPP